MKKQAVYLDINQTIRYYPQGEDAFSFKASGHHYHLATYDKVVYQDPQGHKIEVKWILDEVTDQVLRLEIRQPQGDMVFDTQTATINTYDTPQGTWPLEIETHSLQQLQWDDKTLIKVHYTMSVAQQKLGDYDFQLIFYPQEGNISSRGKEVPHGIE